jgi:hypothetical protein
VAAKATEHVRKQAIHTCILNTAPEIKHSAGFYVHAHSIDTPEGIFAHQKSQFGYILEGFGIKYMYCYIFWTFGTDTYLIPFGTYFRFGALYREKSFSSTWPNTVASDVVDVVAGSGRGHGPELKGLEELGLLSGDERVSRAPLLQVLGVVLDGVALSVDVRPPLRIRGPHHFQGQRDQIQRLFYY